MDPYFIAGLLLVAAIAILLLRRSSASPQTSSPQQPTSQTANAVLDGPTAARHTPKRENEEGWLRDRWKLAKEQEESGSHDGMFPDWYFDQATESQLDRLDLLDVLCDRSALTKGQASDLIGMFEPPGSGEVAILEFFGVSTQGWKRTRVRHEIAKIFRDPANIKAWEERPAAAGQWGSKGWSDATPCVDIETL